jgi:hypothetical protein
LDWLVVDGLVCLVCYLLLFKLFHSSEKANKKQNNINQQQHKHTHTTHTIKTERMRAQKEDDLQTLYFIHSSTKTKTKQFVVHIFYQNKKT